MEKQLYSYEMQGLTRKSQPSGPRCAWRGKHVLELMENIRSPSTGNVSPANHKSLVQGKDGEVKIV